MLSSSCAIIKTRMTVERMSMKSKMLMSSTGMKIVQYLPQQQEKNPYNKCQYVESIKIHWIKNERLMLKNALGKSGDFRRNYLNIDLLLHQNQSNQTDGQANHRFENIPESHQGWWWWRTSVGVVVHPIKETVAARLVVCKNSLWRRPNRPHIG